MFAFVRINSALSVEEKAPDYFWKAPKCYTLEGSNPRTPRPESDVYALGMCIFEAMCGEKPFEGVKEQAAIDKIRKGELPNRPDNKITDETWNLIAKMCCRNFQDRIRLDIVIAELQVLAGREQTSSMCITNLILGRAYQVYFCEPWPTHWKRVPAYLGSKNLVLSTLFFATTTVSAISVASPPLRSLCEAATHIETLALAITFGHFVILHFFLDKDDGSKLRCK
ncbi:hypothetical protein PHYBOEH_007592 [Phytophthora boehmeriae]|uniref:Protein kinase domain-containing protein n=1 Tax=Phytophthora boehmeriae TaxID=109152 RepID=A0A8T1X2F9_9STRA|nr:hypothetical protein PHYBOEH_007592 [Phytophthora boehmeriae]